MWDLQFLQNATFGDEGAVMMAENLAKAIIEGKKPPYYTQTTCAHLFAGRSSVLRDLVMFSPSSIPLGFHYEACVAHLPEQEGFKALAELAEIFFEAGNDQDMDRFLVCNGRIKHLLPFLSDGVLCFIQQTWFPDERKVKGEYVRRSFCDELYYRQREDCLQVVEAYLQKREMEKRWDPESFPERKKRL